MKISNIIKFKKNCDEGKKCNSHFAVRLAVILLIIVSIIKIFALDDFRPLIYKRHDVMMLRKPVKILQDYMVYDITGKEISLTETMGDKITILAFWATWCGYCAEEFPAMDALFSYLENHGIKILPIARGDDTPEKIKKFFNRGHIKNMETVIASNQNLHKALGISYYPAFIAVDENGMAFARLRPKWEAPDIFDLFEKIGKEKR